MKDFPSSLLFRFSKYSVIVIFFFFLSGCGIENTTLKNSDENKTISLNEIPVLSPKGSRFRGYSGTQFSGF
jgi:hypothetical protein